MAELSREKLARLAYQAGFRGDDIWKVIAIAGRESGYNPRAYNPNASTGDKSYGLMQINMIGSMMQDRLRQFGITSPEQLFDPLTNLKAAHSLYQGRDNSFYDWGPYKGVSELYGTDPMAAQAAYNQVRQAGWPPATGGQGAAPQGPESMADVAQGLGNLGAPGYRQYASDPRRQINSRYQAIMLAGGGGGRPAPPDPTFFNWQEHPELNDQYNALSPHLQAFEKWTMKQYGGASLGDYAERDVVGGSAPSSHAFGAAWDWKPEDRADADAMIKLVTENPGAFGIQAIHDYKNSRVWRVGREGDLGGGWESQAPGSHGGEMGTATHLHFETNPDVWNRIGRRNWRMMGRAKRGVYSENGQTLTPEQFGNIAERKGNRGNPLFEDYATIGPRMLQRRQNRWIANTPGQPGGTQGPPSQALTNLLGDLGINYPAEKITPTPALLAYLAGVGLDLSTAQDLQRMALNRIRVNTAASRQDIKRGARRATRGITGDLISRGVLSSGEANTRYAEHAQDVADQRSDLARMGSQLREDTAFAYNQSTQGLTRDALQRLADLETQQAIDRRTNRAQTRGYRRANRAAQTQYEREQQAQEDRNQALIDLINGLYRRPTPTPTTTSTPSYPGGVIGGGPR